MCRACLLAIAIAAEACAQTPIGRCIFARHRAPSEAAQRSLRSIRGLNLAPPERAYAGEALLETLGAENVRINSRAAPAANASGQVIARVRWEIPNVMRMLWSGNRPV